MPGLRITCTLNGHVSARSGRSGACPLFALQPHYRGHSWRYRIGENFVLLSIGQPARKLGHVSARSLKLALASHLHDTPHHRGCRRPISKSVRGLLAKHDQNLHTKRTTRGQGPSASQLIAVCLHCQPQHCLLKHNKHIFELVRVRCVEHQQRPRTTGDALRHDVACATIQESQIQIRARL